MRAKFCWESLGPESTRTDGSGPNARSQCQAGVEETGPGVPAFLVGAFCRILGLHNFLPIFVLPPVKPTKSSGEQVAQPRIFAKHLKEGKRAKLEKRLLACPVQRGSS